MVSDMMKSAVIPALLSFGLVPSAANALPAFPGAQGFGARATGGRGGEVYHVTNLNDSGPGSFRDAVGKGGRIVVFDVGGYIDLKSPVSVASNLTVAGQTAPGEGIGTKNQQVSFSGAENVIVRYIRFRCGLKAPSGADGVTLHKGKNMIFDHVSVAWGRDETFSINESRDITVQHSIIAEGLLKHSMGGLVQWNTITLHHNLYTTNNDRNPKAKGVIDFVNNVVYNWGAYGFVAGDSAGRSDVNVVGNCFIAGPSSTRRDDPLFRGNANFHLYFEGNYFDGDVNGALDGKPVTWSDVDDPVVWEAKRYDYPVVRTEPALDAYHRVIATAGASLVRDSVDKRLIDNVVKQTGSLISDPATVGGFGTLAGGAAPTDTDGDGMPDAWERQRGLNPDRPSDRSGDFDRTGYTNIEKYINGLADGPHPRGTRA
jgi:pectate lyase